MSTEFSYEHVFRAPTVETIIEAYFDMDHLAYQDKLAELGDREVTDSHDDGVVRKATWRVVSLKPLPMFVRPFVKGGRLAFLETMSWKRGGGLVEASVTPDILNGRVSIASRYELSNILIFSSR